MSVWYTSSVHPQKLTLCLCKIENAHKRYRGSVGGVCELQSQLVFIYRMQSGGFYMVWILCSALYWNSHLTYSANVIHNKYECGCPCEHVAKPYFISGSRPSDPFKSLPCTWNSSYRTYLIIRFSNLIVIWLHVTASVSVFCLLFKLFMKLNDSRFCLY